MLARTGRIIGVGASVIYIRVLDCIMNVSQEGAQLALELWKSDFWYSLFQVLAYLKINVCGSCWAVSIILKLYSFLDKIAVLAGFLLIFGLSCSQKYCVRKYTEEQPVPLCNLASMYAQPQDGLKM